MLLYYWPFDKYLLAIILLTAQLLTYSLCHQAALRTVFLFVRSFLLLFVLTHLHLQNNKAFSKNLKSLQNDKLEKGHSSHKLIRVFFFFFFFFRCCCCFLGGFLCVFFFFFQNQMIYSLAPISLPNNKTLAQTLFILNTI